MRFIKCPKAMPSVISIYFLITVNTLECMQDLAISRQIPIEQIYHMLEGSDAFEKDKVPEIKDKIVGYLHDQTTKSIRKVYDTILDDHESISLESFMSPDTKYTEATFITDHEVTLINFKEMLAAEETPAQILLINTETLESKQLAHDILVNYRMVGSFPAKNYFNIIVGQDKTFLFYNSRLCDLSGESKVPTGLSMCRPGCELYAHGRTNVIGLTDDKKYIISHQTYLQPKKAHYVRKANEPKEYKTDIQFFDIENLCLDESKRISTGAFERIAHHPKKKMLACNDTYANGLTLFYDYSSKNSQMIAWEPKVKKDKWDEKIDYLISIEFNHDGSLLLIDLGMRFLIFNPITLEYLHEIHKQENKTTSWHILAGPVRFCENRRITSHVDNEIIDIEESGVALSQKPALSIGKATNKNGTFIFECQDNKMLYISRPTPGRPTCKEFEELTLKQRRFIELLYALKCTYQERLEQLKKINPAKYDDIERLNIMLKYIPERVKGFPFKDIQGTWQSYKEPTQQFLRKCFNVVE
jgi:hypothetical protein